MTETTATKYTVVNYTLRDPREPGVFVKRKASDPAVFTTIECSCESCPLLAAGQCVETFILGGGCPYGRVRSEGGPTRRSSKVHEWIEERKARHPGLGWKLKAPPKRMAYIGEYVYLPYPHMDMCKQVPFVRHSAFFVSGIEFVPRESWTIESVLTLIDFRPHAMMGGEITSYQKESVPKFLEHLREVDPSLWAQLIAARPQYDKAPNYVGRSALIATLAHPILIGPYDVRYPVYWKWNGKTLTTTDKHAYNNTWGHVDAESMTLEIVPAKNAATVVKSNSWVTSDTVFID